MPYSWREAYELALTEGDPGKLVGRIEHSLNVLERRYSQWGIDPGTPAELMAIQKCVSTLQRLMKQEQLGVMALSFHRRKPQLVGWHNIACSE